MYSQYRSIWPFSCASRRTALPMPARVSTSKPLASSSCDVIAAMICCSVKFLPPTTSVSAAAGAAPSAPAPSTAKASGAAGAPGERGKCVHRIDLQVMDVEGASAGRRAADRATSEAG